MDVIHNGADLLLRNYQEVYLCCEFFLVNKQLYSSVVCLIRPRLELVHLQIAFDSTYEELWSL